DQSRKDIQAAATNGEIVEAAAKSYAAHLADAQSPALGAVLVGQLLERDHAVRDALQMIVLGAAGPVVQQEYGAIMAGEVLFERKHLTPIPQCVLRDQPQL